MYTDTDALGCQRALLHDNDNTAVVHADHLQPHRLLTHETVCSALDLTRPVAVLITTGVQDEPDDRRLAAALAGYRVLLPRGSALALSCWSPPAESHGTDFLIRAIERTWESRCFQAIHCRTAIDIQRLSPDSPCSTRAWYG
ncbi:SAM-dependent methyltransferase [Amycolatopsis sp. H6(2020)]|nr:SAM-dependent methyltransferase [Amycolatopsis sp. H6(2020)]